MGFFTDMFSPPRAGDIIRMPATLSAIDTPGNWRRTETTSRPVDFKRQSREPAWT